MNNVAATTTQKTAIIIALFCTSILAICYFYGAHIGLNTRITAGAELDASGISIALSRLWFGLHEGYVGYQMIYDAILQTLTGGRHPNNPDGFPLLSDPSVIAYAFAQVRAIIPDSLPSYSVFSPLFISISMEDHGIADFYSLAFLLFGVKPTAMYNLYFFLFSTSIVLFIIEYRRQSVPLVLLALIVGSFPIFFFSNNFSIYVPSINANRFIPTLGFIPTLYIICMYFQSASLNKMQWLRLLAQCILFAFVLSVRKCTQWELITLTAFTFMIALPLLWAKYKDGFKLEDLRLAKQPLFSGTIFLVLFIVLYQGIQGMMLNPIYKTDCSPPNHAFWHSAYLSFAISPEWQKYNLSNRQGDGMAMGEFEQFMQARGLDPICHITNSYLFGMHEIVIKHFFLNFIAHHKMFAVKLYGIYKPWTIVRSYWYRLLNLSIVCLIYSVFLSIIAGIFLSKSFNKNIISAGQIFSVSLLFLLGSWMPSMLAYPSQFNNDDFWMFYIFMSFSICAFSYWILGKRRS